MKCALEWCNEEAEEIYTGHFDGYVTKLAGKPLCEHHLALEMFKELSELETKNFKKFTKLKALFEEVAKEK